MAAYLGYAISFLTIGAAWLVHSVLGTTPGATHSPNDARFRRGVELVRGRAVTYRVFFSHVVDVVEAVGATILIVGGLGRVCARTHVRLPLHTVRTPSVISARTWAG